MGPILLATDGSASARLATAQGIELARATGWPLRIVTVWSIPPSELGSAAVSALPGVADAEREHAKGVLRATEAAVTKAGLTSTTVLHHGLTAEAICDEARACAARLVVVGARGWGRLGRFAFGSVSQGVLELAPCPVLVVRAAASSGLRPST